MFSEPVSAKRGQMIGIFHYANSLAVQTDDSSQTSDYFLNSNSSSTTIYKINYLNNWRFYVRALFNTSYYHERGIMALDYENVIGNETSGSYSLNTFFLNSTTNVTRYFMVTNCKYSIFEKNI